jgi:L-serine dehydratase
MHAKTSSTRFTKSILLAGRSAVSFHPSQDLVFNRDISLPFHPNGLTFSAYLDDGSHHSETYYSTGGGFVVKEGETAGGPDPIRLPFPIETAAQLLHHCQANGWTIPEVFRRNEASWRSPVEIRDGLNQLSSTMKACVARGCCTEGVLPGPLGVSRRAPGMCRTLLGGRQLAEVEDWAGTIRRECPGFRETLKWVSCFALAVNEENAAFGRVVTAPTNGAAGVVPAVLHYYDLFCEPSATGIEDFLLAAGEIGSLFKKGATLSAAMGGCQAEVGVSSAMAAAGLCQVLGGSPERVLMAAEIAMEDHLGLTCDPIGGLVQIPCIERNAMGAMKAITACHLALESDPARAKVSLDAVIRSM